MAETPRPILFVGVDWGTKELEVCAEDPAGCVVGVRGFANIGAGLRELVDWLVTRTDGGPETVGIAIELSHGPVVETLLERGFRVFAINPKQLDRFRDRFTVAGAKDDRLDARVLADSLRTDPQAFRALRIDSPALLELREWSRMTDDLQQERVRMTNRLREQLRRFYPQALELTEDHGADSFLALLELVPTPGAARRRRPTSVARVLREHRIRRMTAPDVLEILRQTPVHVAPGTEEAATVHIGLLTDRLRLVNRQIRECHRRLDVICKNLPAASAEEDDESNGCEQRDAEILRSFPGVGRIVLATLLAEATQPLASRDLPALRSLTGVAPVTRRSGKRCAVSMRQACHGRLREAVCHWARVAAQCDPHWKRRYGAFRKRGHSHGRACRGIADRLLAALVAALKTDSIYDPSRLSDHSRERAA
jgi:transposase